VQEESLLSMRVPATLRGVRMLCTALVGVLREQCDDDRFVDQFESAVAEAANNIVQHGLKQCAGGCIEVSVSVAGDTVSVALRDQAPPFNPLTRLSGQNEPLLDIAAATEEHAGVGLKLLRRMVDALEYRREPDGNRLILRKRLPAADGAAARGEGV